VHSYTDSDLPDSDNIVLFENSTPINQNKGQNKRTQSRLIRLIKCPSASDSILEIGAI